MNIHVNPYDDELLAAVSEALNYTPSAEEQIEMRIDSIVRELDELCRLASDPETVDLVEAQKVGIGQIVTRAQLVMSFLLAQKPAGLRMVVNHG